jgi:hypothetical protein
VLYSTAPIWSAQGINRNTRTVQWGPWAEVGMAVQKNTLTRVKTMGVGALSTATGICIMSSTLHGSTIMLGTCLMNWAKYLKIGYQDVPAFHYDMKASVKKDFL